MKTKNIQAREKLKRKPSAQVPKTMTAQPPYDYSTFKKRHQNKIVACAGLLLFLFVFNLFRNNAYTLFRADESMTVMGAERVLQYGYPKVHDGKNVFYDLRHSDPTLGINAQTDAYVGGTGWLHYYYGALPHALAESTNDLYQKTAIFRISFAIAGLLALALILYWMSKLLPDRFSRFVMIALFLLVENSSVSMILHLKEVRYYALALLFTAIPVCLYCLHRFYRPFRKMIFYPAFLLSCWLLFHAFSPVFFIVLLSIGIAEALMGAVFFYEKDLATAWKKTYPQLLLLAVSLLTVWPLFSYFKTFQISKAMAEYNGFSREMYWGNLSTAFSYFSQAHLIWLAIALKLLTLIPIPKTPESARPVFRVSSFLALFIVVYLFTIARIPNFLFTRDLIPLQPFLTIMLVLDFLLLFFRYASHSRHLIALPMLLPTSLFIIFFLIHLAVNKESLQGRIHEWSHRYKGPLDHTIPFIRAQYKKTDTLVIAANYEETSYMYYLKSKVIVGFAGTNLATDSLLQPHVLANRNSWGSFGDVFQKYRDQQTYKVKRFPVRDNYFNNIPELYFTEALSHRFYEVEPVAGDSTELFYR